MTGELLRMPPAQAARIAREHYGWTGATDRLASERDDTFLIGSQQGSFGIMRVSPVDRAPAELSFQTALLRYLGS